MGLRSVDAPRERPAPSSYLVHLSGDNEQRRHFSALTLVVAVKPGCDGCRDFIEGGHDLEKVVDVVVVAALDDPAWEARDVVVSSGLWRDLEIRSAPFYVLVDAARSLVVAEGSVFSAAQVAEEIAEYLGT
jgi:hypothetical protein